MCFYLDIDECARGVATCDLKTSQCKNNEGGYVCNCNSGFEHVQGDLKTCEGEKTRFYGLTNPENDFIWTCFGLAGYRETTQRSMGREDGWYTKKLKVYKNIIFPC